MSKIIIRSKIGLAVQLLGVLFSYFGVLVIARFDGPQAQGYFVTLKSFVDTANGAFVAGLPQALILAINRGRFNLRSAGPYVWVYGLLVFLISIPVSWKLVGLEGEQLQLAILFLPIGIAGSSLFGLTRALLLTHTDGFGFSIFTAFPQVMLFAAICIEAVLLHQDYATIYLVYGITVTAGSLLVSYRLFAREPNEARLPLPVKGLFREGTHIFAQSMLYNAQWFLVLRLLSATGAPRGELGLVSTALLPLLALHALVGIVAPILYNQWSKLETPTDFGAMATYLFKLSGLGQLLALPLLFLVQPVVMLVFGEKYVGSIGGVYVVIFATLPVLFTRTISPFLQTSGRARLNSVSCMLRAASALTFLSVAIGSGWSGVVPVAVAWSAAEWAAFLFVVAAWKLKQFAPKLHFA
jgi:O-antigen/teichoic acid export membrane protein